MRGGWCCPPLSEAERRFADHVIRWHADGHGLYSNWRACPFGFEGVENLALDGAFIIIANHESWFDVWALAGCLPIDVRFAAKKDLARIPVFGRAWQACGHISVDRANRASAIKSMTQAGRQIREEGLHTVFFAEGTRSPDGALQAFKKSPFVIAIEGGVSIVPVGLVGSRRVMPKGSFRILPGTITVRVGEPISVEGVKLAD